MKRDKYSFFSKKRNAVVMAFVAKENKNSVWLETGVEKISEEKSIPILIKKKRSQVELVSDKKNSSNK